MYIRFISPSLSVGFARKFVIDVTIREIKYLTCIKMVLGAGSWDVSSGIPHPTEESVRCFKVQV